MISKLIQFVFKLPENPIKEAIRQIYYGDLISERIIEYPLIFKHLEEDEGKILDVGCYFSALPIQMASMGFDVYAIDPEGYQLKHPNFKFFKGDVQESPFKRGFFDTVTVVSTLEHIGLGFYKDKRDYRGDKEAVKEIRKVLKRNGKLLLTVPYSKRYKVTNSQRMYDNKSLTDLLNPEFKVVKKLLFKSVKGKWLPATEKSTPLVKGTVTKAIAFVLAKKS